MVIFIFFISNKDSRKKFFKKSFLLAGIKPDILLEILFLIISNADVDFQARNLQWRSYITRNVFLTTRNIELIRQKEFAAAAFDPKHETFVVYIATLSVDSNDEMHPSKKA